MKWLSAPKWRPSRIGPRLLAFNLLVMFVPVAGVLYLDIYEKGLLEAQEREMVQQARVLAAVLGEDPRIDGSRVAQTFARMERRTEARLRVFSADGTLQADSRLVPGPVVAAEEAPGEYSASSSARERALYRFGATLASVRERMASAVRRWVVATPLAPDPAPSGVQLEVQQALRGHYGAATYRTPGQRSLTLVSAVPVRHEGRTIGVVVVSQSTFRILQTLYQIRLRVFEIVLLSMAVAAVLTAVAAATIVRPLKQLRRQASALADRRVPLNAAFPGAARRDEIGDLARSLEVLTRRLADHIARLESFAADVAHEFRNPLASIRTAAETIGESATAAERERFLELMRKDVERLDRLVSGVREMARVDGQLEHEPLETVAIVDLLQEAIETIRLASHQPTAITLRSDGDVLVRGGHERLSQALENVLANAASLSPENSPIEVEVDSPPGQVRITVADRGPGIPDAHLSRIFDRFFSYRPGEERREHVGLGLAIARQIIESYGGTIIARNRDRGGSVFEIVLPRAT